MSGTIDIADVVRGLFETHVDQQLLDQDAVNECPFEVGSLAVRFTSDGRFAKAAVNWAAKYKYCSECGNTRYRFEPLYRPDLVSGEVGQRIYTQARPCPGATPERIVELWNAARIPASFALADLKDLQLREGQRRAATTALQHVIAFGAWRKGNPAPPGLSLFGEPGVGKSHIMAGALKRLVVDYRVPVLWLDLRDLAEEIRGDWSGEAELLERACSVRVLALDDVGRGLPGKHEAKLLEKIVHRRARRTDLQTWLTTEKALHQLEAWAVERRTASRLVSMTQRMSIESQDARRERQQNRAKPAPHHARGGGDE